MFILIRIIYLLTKFTKIIVGYLTDHPVKVILLR
jgi:hypothetical protein